MPEFQGQTGSESGIAAVALWLTGFPPLERTSVS